MLNLNDADFISCSRNYKINIINSVLFDPGTIGCVFNRSMIIQYITKDLQDLCINSNCSISKSFIIDSLDSDVAVMNLSLYTTWSCYLGSCNVFFKIPYQNFESHF